jgi:outer membrane receptor protein involved in Fe transport
LTISPRLQLAYRLSPGLTLRGAWGHYYQSPNYRQITYGVASDTNARSQRAIHYAVGIDYTASIGKDLQKFIKLKLEGFYKKYDNLMSAVQTSDGFLYYSRRNDAVGFAKGFDFYLMYSAPDFSGWVSYGYLIAEQDILDDTYGPHPRYSDQRHTLSATGTWEPGRRWSLNLRFVYGSGYPFTPSTSLYDPARKTWVWISGAPNSGRLPSYSRTDFRVTKNFSLFGFSTSAFLDVSNMFNVKNLQSYRYSFDGNGRPLRKEQYLWPIIPSVGMSVRM